MRTSAVSPQARAFNPPKLAEALPDPPSRLSTYLDRAIYFLFILFAASLPFSVKGAQHAWKLAFLLWLIKLGIDRKHPLPAPRSLLLPLICFVVLSAISSTLSPDPLLSWDRMKIVCLVLVGVLFASALKNFAQVRFLLIIFLLSGLAAASYTAWQYTHGIGVRIDQINRPSALWNKGIKKNDILARINGQALHAPEQLSRAIAQVLGDTPISIDYLRGYPLAHLKTTATREDFVASGLGTDALRLAKGTPFRAQGTLPHYIVFAEMLMQLGCLAWAMLLTSFDKRIARWLYALILLATTASLFATETRAALSGLALGCFVALVMIAKPRLRIWGVVALAVLGITSALWVLHTRHLEWIDLNDPGTRFRVLMWEDGLRLVRQHPWFGVGMESVRDHWQEWNIRGFAQFHVISHFHSTFLQIAVERGLPALAAWLWFVIAYLIFLFQLVRLALQQHSPALGPAAGILAAFSAFITSSFVHYNLGEEQLVTLVFFLFGVAIALHRLVTAETATHS